jgi:glycyl-tRNA synthetase
MASDTDRMERLVALAKRRGFIFPSSEIYGGLNGFWDYGPLGVELKRNIKQAWWDDIVRRPPVGPDGEPIEMVGLDCSIIMNPTVWEASGHLAGFADPMCTCRQCQKHFRADQVYLVGYAPRANFKELAQSMVSEYHRLKQEMEEHLASARSEQEKKKIRQEYDQLMTANDQRMRPVVQKAVIAGNPQEAVARAPLTKRQIDTLGQLEVSFAMPLANIHLEPGGMWARGLPRPDCPACGAPEALTEARQFNLMFKSHAGAMEDSASEVYLRPETAQGIFVNFKNVLDTQRLKLPFGIAQIGKAFRNEINPRNYTFRSREFEQMEIEFFCHPDDAPRWYEWWRDARYDWYVRHGLTSDRLHLRDHEEDELAHYAAACADVEYDFPFGVSELEGIANRTDFDLKAHQEHSGRDMAYFDEERWQEDAPKYKPEHYDGDKKAAKAAADEAKAGMPYRFIPYVIEPSGGVDRAALAFLCEAYDEDEAPDEKGNLQSRTVLRLHPRLAPVKVAVFPLVKKDGMPEKARALYEACREEMTAFYDEKGAVGRRYRRQDEAGTPFCVTVDGQTNEDGTVTVRDRDSMEQVRVPSEGLVAWLTERLGGA